MKQPSTGPNGEVHAFTTNPRTRLTDQQRARLFLERGGQCHKCTRKIAAGEDWIDEHLIALENGGTNDWDNRGITCKFCLPVKNAEDDKLAAKTRAVATRHIVPTSRREKKWRPLAGTKASGLRKRMDGTVERRR